MPDLTVVIPSRNEMFLSRTVSSVLNAITSDTHIIIVCDGNWPDPPIEDHPRVHTIHHATSIGQRAATNEGVLLAQSRYVLKLDAHCDMARGFDTVLMADMQPDWTVVPLMRNLHIHDWLCPDGHRRYQGPSGPCTQCGKPTERDIVWVSKPSPKSTSYCFDETPHFQYFRDFSKRPEGRGELTETMSLQGSCFMMERDRYLALDVCDEEFGSWGSQGIEVAVKSWLSGGRVLVNHKTFYSHCFRTQGGDFGFPYPLSGNQVERARRRAKDLFFMDAWPGQVRPLSWLLDKFWPVPGWSDESRAAVMEAGVTWENKRRAVEAPAIIPERPPTKGLIYYSDNRPDPDLLAACQRQLDRARGQLPVVSVSLLPLHWSSNHVHPIVIGKQRGIRTMFEQILLALETSTAEVVFFCEHDLLYSQTHFEFTPERQDAYYYNTHTWKVDSLTGQALYYTTKQTSGLCGYRQLLLDHYRARLAKMAQNVLDLTARGEPVKNDGFSRHMGFEPGCHQPPRGVDSYPALTWTSPQPNIDIRHQHNLTSSRWSQSEFRDPKSCLGWTLSDQVPGWGVTKGRFKEFLASLAQA